MWAWQTGNETIGKKKWTQLWAPALLTEQLGCVNITTWPATPNEHHTQLFVSSILLQNSNKEQEGDFNNLIVDIFRGKFFSNAFIIVFQKPKQTASKVFYVTENLEDRETCSVNNGNAVQAKGNPECTF